MHKINAYVYCVSVYILCGCTCYSCVCTICAHVYIKVYKSVGLGLNLILYPLKGGSVSGCG